MYATATKPTLMIRLPADLKAWLEKKARHEAASQNTLVVQALRRAQSEEEKSK